MDTKISIIRNFLQSSRTLQIKSVFVLKESCQRTWVSMLRLSQAEKKDEVEKCSCRSRLHILYLVGYFARSDEAEETPWLLCPGCSEMFPACTKDQFIFKHQMLPHCHIQPHSQSTNKARQVEKCTVQDTWSQLQLKEPEPDYLAELELNLIVVICPARSNAVCNSRY